VIRSRKERGRREAIWIAHSPTRRDYKGTEDIIRAVDGLKEEGLNVHLALIERMPHAECLKLKARCDITYDQMHLCYGNSGLEGMALGHPTIVGMSDSVREEVQRIVGYEPFCFASPETLRDVLRDLVQDREIRQSYGALGKRYVEEWHDHQRVAQRVARIYEQLIRGELDDKI
jgi:hypothetical protein